MSTNVLTRLERLEEKIDRLLVERDEVLDIAAVCDLTGYSRQTLYNKANTGGIPHFKRDGKLFFRRSEIIEWLLEHRVPTQRQIDQAAGRYIATGTHAGGR